MNRIFNPSFILGFLCSIVLITGLIVGNLVFEQSGPKGNEAQAATLDLIQVPDPNQPWPLASTLPAIIRKKPLVINAVGDVLLARDVERRIKQFGWKHPFDGVATLIQEGDLNFCNLETPVSFIGSPYPGKPPNITFRANPGTLFALKHAGFNMISLANNHMTDHGPLALEETLDALDILGILHAGAGRNRTEAYAPRIIQKNGWTLAFFAYADPIWSVVEAREDPGVAHMKEATILEAVDSARKTKGIDLILVSLHWGEEYNHRPSPAQRALAARIIEAGADVILGHHPHVLQGVQWHLGKPILYSLGNFAFDQIDDPTYQSVLARLVVQTDGSLSLRMRPLRIARQTLNQTIPTGADLSMISENIVSYCKVLGTEAIPCDDGWIQFSPPVP